MHLIPSPRNILSIVALALLTPSGLLAHEDKPHTGPAQAGPMQDPVAIAGAAVAQIESLVSARRLDGIHEQTDLLAAALREIARDADRLGADQKRRLDAAVKQVALLGDSVHEAADAGQQKKAEAEARKLTAALKLLQAQSGGPMVSPAKPAASAEPHQQPSNDEDAVKTVLAAYKQGLEKLDVSQLSHLFSSDSQVFESGGVEGTFTNYLAHHIGPELDEFAEFSFRDYKVDVRIDLPYAFATETYLYKIVLKADGRVVERKGVATSVLKKSAGRWQIIQTHTSSRNPPKAK